MATVDVLPETAGGPLAPARRRRRSCALRGRLWTLTMVAHVIPFAGAAALLMWMQPLALPVALVCLAHAWIIPELYAQRGANVLRPPRRRGAAPASRRRGPEQRSVGLLGDLVGHEARELHAAHGARRRARPARHVDRGGDGRGPAARPPPPARVLLLREGRPAPGGRPRAALRRPHRAPAARPAQRRAGFATVANLAFAGATWRLRRRMRRRDAAGAEGGPRAARQPVERGAPESGTAGQCPRARARPQDHGHA